MGDALFSFLSNGIRATRCRTKGATVFKVNDKVRRNPKIWKRDDTTFTVVRIEGSKCYVQRPGKTECPWTGKQVPHDALPYEARELVKA